MKTYSFRLSLALIWLPTIVFSRLNTADLLSPFFPDGPTYADPTDRPAFLKWPLPSDISPNSITAYPNTPWTWNYLGLNPGYQCPPLIIEGNVAHPIYLDDPNSLSYWRDTSIPETEDRMRADPHNFGWVDCYASLDSYPVGSNGHEGTDIMAPTGTPISAAADGILYEAQSTDIGWRIIVYHCMGGQWGDNFVCNNGQRWYTTYLHGKNPVAGLVSGKSIVAGEKLAEIDENYAHLHFEVGLDNRAYVNFVNPWGRESSPWDGCMWINQNLCPLSLASAPANQNIVRNSDFSANTEHWWFRVDGEIDYQVLSGVLHFNRRVSSLNYASVAQGLNYSSNVNSPFEISLDLGNTSNVTKTVKISLHDASSWNGSLECRFTLQPNSPLKLYGIRGRTSAFMPNLLFEIHVDQPDGLPAVNVDNISVKYRPDLTISETLCIASPPADQSIVRNGIFTSGIDSWWFRVDGEIDYQVLGGVLYFHRRVTSSNFASVAQGLNYSGNTNSPFEVSLDLGNTSNMTKTVKISLHDVSSWNGSLECNFTLPPKSSLRTYKVRGRILTTTLNLLFEAHANEPDGISDVIMDNIAVQYRPTLSVSTTQCSSPANRFLYLPLIRK